MRKAFWILLEKNRTLGRDVLSSLRGPQAGLTLSLTTFGAFLHCCSPFLLARAPSQVSAAVPVTESGPAGRLRDPRESPVMACPR